MESLKRYSKTNTICKSISCSNEFDDREITMSDLDTEIPQVVIRSNSVPFHAENSTKRKHFRNNNNPIHDITNQDIKIPLISYTNKVGDISQSRKISSSSKHSRESELEKTIKITAGSVQKWNKLRTVMTMTSAMKSKRNLERQDSFIKKFTTQRGIDNELSQEESQCLEAENVPIIKTSLMQKFIIDPQSGVMCIWLGIVTVAVLYNLWTCIARQAFSDILIGYESLWIVFDILADIVYLLDIGIQMRTSYLERGLCVFKTKKLAKRYVHSKDFIVDLVTLTPLDIVQVYTGFQPLLRFPRFLKVYRAWKWKVIMENRTILPNLWRVVNLTHILFLGCHWFAAFYFMISQVGNFQSSWGYPKPTGDFGSVTRKYLKSFYWSTLTLTTIGDLPPPERNWEYVFTIVSYLIGVFVFATIVGQVGNVITNRNASRLEFEKILDNAKNYMRVHNVPKDLQRRVMRWYDYAWSRGRTSGCSDIASLALLPDKLKTEMALHVNLETLKKVTIFQECRPEFLHDLVLKMRPFIFTPGDLICRKGEVAREMFIISDGVLEVISDSGDVLKKMGSGDFFGEIGILNLDGGVNRRTADVKSVGYAELFVLSKEDVLSALKDHPDAEKLIVKYGTSRLNEMKDRRFQRIIKNKAHMSGLESGNQSIEKSENNSLVTIETPMAFPDSKPPEIQSLSVFKNILNKIKFNKHNNIGNITCNHGNQIMLPASVDKSIRTCEDCAIAKLANEITRESVGVNSFFNHQTNPHSRLNSVPSIVCQESPRDINNFRATSRWVKTGLKISSPWKQSLLIPKSYASRRQSYSNIPQKLDVELEAQNPNQNYPNPISVSEGALENGLELASSISIDGTIGQISESEQPKVNPFLAKTDIRRSTFKLHLDDDRNLDPIATATDYEENHELKLVNESEVSVIVSTFETIIANKMSVIVLPLQSEIKRLQTLCSTQQSEIVHLKEIISRTNSSKVRPSAAFIE